MTSTLKRQAVIDFMEMTRQEPGAIGKKLREAVNNRGHISIDDFVNLILEDATPPFRATLDAAEDFMRVINYNGKLSELPHLNDIYALAHTDLSAPKKIFNEAALWLRDKGPNIENAILIAVLPYKQEPRQELN